MRRMHYCLWLGLHHGINDNPRLKPASFHNKQNKAHFPFFMSRQEVGHPAVDFVGHNLEGPIIGLPSGVFRWLLQTWLIRGAKLSSDKNI